MATRTSAAARKSPAKRLAPVHTHPVAPSGRFAELLATLHVPEPYEITPNLIIQPPSKRQMKQIAESQAAFAIASGQLRELLTPTLVTKLDDEGKPVLNGEGKPILIEGPLPQVDSAYLDQINEVVSSSNESYNRALFGDAYTGVNEFFEDRPKEEWNAFYADVQDRFMPVPDDGKCPTCGHVEEPEQEGKPLESSPS